MSIGHQFAFFGKCLFRPSAHFLIVFVVVVVAAVIVWF